jgi:peptidylprolyl isomerase
MCNSGKNSNGSQFFITFGPAPQLNGQLAQPLCFALRALVTSLMSFTRWRQLAGKHVVFGKVVSGFEVLEQMEAVGVPAGHDGEPTKTVLIFDCGLLP